MAFKFWEADIVSVSFDQSFLNSQFKLFWNLDLVLKFAWTLWCELHKSSTWKDITLKLRMGDILTEKVVSYDLAHKYATRLLGELSTDDEGFQESLSILFT